MPNITLEKFENLIEKLRKAVKDYYARYCHEKQIEIYLANGDKIFYAIPENAIAHLLGVNTNYLLSKSVFTLKNKSSIEVLNALCDEQNTFRLFQLISQGHLNFNSMFSEYLNEKLDAFDKVIQPYIGEMEFVCKIDKDICHNNGVDTIPVDYLLCSKDENENYLLLGIGKENGKYVGVTSQSHSDLESLKENWGNIIEQQELTFASKIVLKNKYGDYRNFNAVIPYAERPEKVRKLQFYKDTFNSLYNISYDYILLAVQNAQNYTNINEIITWMETKNPITEDMMISLPYLGNNLKKVIDAYNNSLFTKSSDSSTEYSALATQNKTLLEELRLLRQQVSELTSKNNELEETNKTLTSENEEYRTTLEGIETSIQKVLKPIKQ